MKYYEIVRELAEENLDAMKTHRRYLHENPELAHEEFLTQQRVIEVLSELDIPYQILAETGVVGIIQGHHSGKTVLLRGDMDALPVYEEVDVSYRSKVDGKMHACGHDGHTAGLLGAAMILNAMKDEIHGTVKLMFQPAEETDGGAQTMIDEGIMENPKVDAAFGLHLGGHLEHGKVEIKYGPMFGAPDEFEIKIQGRGGHAASPEQTIDPIIIATQIIQSAQSLLTRQKDPMKPAVISFTSIHAGEGLNVIPDTCYLGGTIRTLYPDTREFLATRLQEIVDSLCTLNGATASFEFMPSYPPLINDDETTRFAHQQLSNYFGEETVVEKEFASLGAEDFAYVALAVPSCYYNVGIFEQGAEEPVHHHPKFAWNDDILETTSSSLAILALDYLTLNSK